MTLYFSLRMPRTISHQRAQQLHEYWAYRCTSDNCVRVEDRLEYLQLAAPVIVGRPLPLPRKPRNKDKRKRHSCAAESQCGATIASAWRLVRLTITIAPF